MFTGIIEKKAEVLALKPHRGGRRLMLQVPAGWARLPLGSSVAVDGACLTVCAKNAGSLSFDLLKETLQCTRFSALQAGDLLNLERAMRSTQRVEGHLVQGHVDDVGKVRRVVTGKLEKSLQLAFPGALRPYIVPKGSVAVNGVSLTVGKVGKTDFSVYLIPYTLQVTNLSSKQSGSLVNVETDILAKYYCK